MLILILSVPRLQVMMIPRITDPNLWQQQLPPPKQIL